MPKLQPLGLPSRVPEDAYLKASVGMDSLLWIAKPYYQTFSVPLYLYHVEPRSPKPDMCFYPRILRWVCCLWGCHKLNYRVLLPIRLPSPHQSYFCFQMPIPI